MNHKIIYIKGAPKRGEVLVTNQASAKPNSFGKLMGRFFMTIGMAAVILLVSPFLFMEVHWRLGRLKSQKVATLNENPSKISQVIQSSDLEILQPTDAEFSVVIPKIGVNSVVLANVPAGDKEQYQSALKEGVAHAAGSYFPGQEGTIYLFGHSTDYIWNISRFNAVFYLLKELESGDQVNVFYQGERHTYRVTDKKIVDGEELSYLRPQSGEEKLVLQTCWPPGTTWKRLVVMAKRV